MIHQVIGTFFGLGLVTDSQALIDAVGRGPAAFDRAFPTFRRALKHGIQELVDKDQPSSVVTYLNGFVRVHPPAWERSPGSSPREVPAAMAEAHA